MAASQIFTVLSSDAVAMYLLSQDHARSDTPCALMEARVTSVREYISPRARTDVSHDKCCSIQTWESVNTHLLMTFQRHFGLAVVCIPHLDRLVRRRGRKPQAVRAVGSITMQTHTKENSKWRGQGRVSDRNRTFAHSQYHHEIGCAHLYLMADTARECPLSVNFNTNT